jgi:hypothetical protein
MLVIYKSDDDPFLNGYYANILARQGYSVTCPYCEEINNHPEADKECGLWNDGIMEAVVKIIQANGVEIPQGILVKYRDI